MSATRTARPRAARGDMGPATPPEPPVDAVVRSAPAADVFAALGSRAEGLRGAEAVRRLAQDGPNVLARVRGPGLVRRLAANFTHFMALLLWAGAAIAFVAGLPQLSVAIVLVNVVNGLFSFWQEYRAERATEAL